MIAAKCLYKPPLPKGGMSRKRQGGYTMKKSKILWTIAAILVVVFFVNTGLDWHTYNTTLNSAPFRYWVLVNAVYFLLPAGIMAIVGMVLKHKM